VKNIVVSAESGKGRFVIPRAVESETLQRGETLGPKHKRGNGLRTSLTLWAFSITRAVIGLVQQAMQVLAARRLARR
jgi:hypothetical protein